MWNPDTYRDTDYGLDSDELYEPGEDIDDGFVPAQDEPYVQTVLGPIRLDEVGVALIREYLQWDPAAHRNAGIEGRLIDPNAALLDLEAFFSVGGRTVVSASPRSAGRDARRLLWLAQHAPVHIVAVSGFHDHKTLVHSYGDRAEEAMRADLDSDFNQGMDGTRARPGMLVLATRGEETTQLERLALELVAEFHQRTRVPVSIGSEEGQGALHAMERLSELGVHPMSIIVGSAGLLNDAGELRAVAETGAYVAFDDLGRLREGLDQATAQRVSGLVHDGYGTQVLLSHGFKQRSQLTGYSGRPGLPYIVEQFAVMLLEAGLQALDVRGLLVDNVSRALAVRRPAEGVPALA